MNTFKAKENLQKTARCQTVCFLPRNEINMASESSPSPHFLLYGAYGYTGKLILEHAAQRGLTVLCAGRKEAPLRAAAEAFGFPWLAFDLNQTEALENALQRVPVVLHAAGPYSATAELMVSACIRTQTHYVDITGEVLVFEWIAKQHTAAQKAGIVLLPGAGFDVVPTDCLSAYVAGQIENPTHLEIAFTGAQGISRGTALTSLENLTSGSLIRENGQIKSVPMAHKTRNIDFGKGKRFAAAIPWGDVATAFYSTHIPNIICYTALKTQVYRLMKMSRHMKGLLGAGWMQRFLKKQVNKRISGPTEELRTNAKSYIWAEARNARGEVVAARLTCMEAYKLTAHTALEATLRLTTLDIPAGYHTPSSAFGPDFILAFEGSERSKL